MTTRAQILALALAAGALPASAQTSRLYMQDAAPYGVHNTEVRIAQGGQIVDTFQLQTPKEHNLVIAGDIRTYAGVYSMTDGHRYDLDGSFLGQSYPSVPYPASYYGGDAATDGQKFNWIYDYGYGAVYRYNRKWQNPVRLWENSSILGGITYDTSDNTLWLLETWNGLIRHVKLNGDEISKFSDPSLAPGHNALALDPADGTLWAIEGNTFGDGWRQYDRQGNLLDTGHFGPSKLTGSAEFDILGAGCYADFTTDGVLDLFDFLAYVNAFNSEDPAAECDNDPGLTLFDFLCFVNAFNAGC